MTAHDAVFITSAPDENGNYHLALEWGDDHAESFSAETAMIWVSDIMRAVAQADHDAALLRLLTEKLNQEPRAAALIISSARDIRGGYSPRTKMRLSVMPGVSAFTGEPFLHLLSDKKAIGQWTMGDARSHAVGILQAVANLDCDSATYQVLTQEIELDAPTAMAVISDLSNFFHSQA